MSSNMSVQFDSILQPWLAWVLVGGLLLALAHGITVLIRKRIPARWVAILGGMRLLIIVVFVLILLQPVLSYSQETEDLPELCVLVDTSRSMAQSTANGQSRLRESITHLQQSDLIPALQKRFRLHWFQFDTSAFPVQRDDLGSLKPGGSSTHLADSLSAVANQMHAPGKRAERILLVSDGNDLGKQDPAQTARKLGMTIDTLAPTSAPVAGTSKIDIGDVQCARRVLLGSDTHFRVLLTRTDSAQDQSLTLRLTEDGKTVWSQEVNLKTGEMDQFVTIVHRPATKGVKEYAFHAVQESEPFRVTVEVIDSHYESLILEDTWRWEFKFLKRLFEDDPSFRFTALLPRGEGTFMQFGSPDRRVNLVGFPQGRGELEGFDIFILGDLDPARWSRELAASLAQLVTEEGKSLVVVAGPNVGGLADIPELHQLLPVELTRGSGTPVAGPVAVRIPTSGSSSPFLFQLQSNAGKTLPPLDQIYAPLRKRPAATVLLEAENQANSYGKLIVLAEHTVGKGHVLFVGTDTLWKWHTLAEGASRNEGPTPYSLFWQQAFRALTPARSLLGGTQLWLQPRRTRGETQRPVLVDAEIESSRPLPRARLEAKVELPDKRSLPVAFAADPANPRLFHAEFQSGQPGAHTIRASMIVEGKTVAAATAVVHIDLSRAEENDRGIDHANLQRLATSTGGSVIDTARPDTWPQAKTQPHSVVIQQRTFDLWNNFVLISLLCGLLGIDWTCRIVKGFV